MLRIVAIEAVIDTAAIVVPVLCVKIAVKIGIAKFY